MKKHQEKQSFADLLSLILLITAVVKNHFFRTFFTIYQDDKSYEYFTHCERIRHHYKSIDSWHLLQRKILAFNLSKSQDIFFRFKISLQTFSF